MAGPQTVDMTEATRSVRTDPPGRIRVIRMIARLNVGGPAWNAVLLTAGTRARYPTILAVGATGPHEGDMSRIAEERGVAPLRIAGLGRELRPLSDLRALWTLWRLCRRFRPAIVHTHTAKAGTLGRVAAWLAGVPVRVHTFHGHVFKGYFSNWRSAVYVAIERLLARITTRIVAISPRQAEELQAYLRTPPTRITVIPLGLELEHLIATDAPACRRRFRDRIEAADDDVVISVVGRLTAIKNCALAVRAVARVTKAIPAALLTFVGGGEEERRLRELARSLGVADRVRFAGWWSDLGAVYHGSDVVALTSDNEGTPACLIEALTCSTPVIATDVGGVADVLENGRLGKLVPAGDEEAMAAALVQLCDPAVRTRVGTGAAEAVRRRYSVARLVADMEALYDDLLAEPQQQRAHGRRLSVGQA